MLYKILLFIAKDRETSFIVDAPRLDCIRKLCLCKIIEAVVKC